MTRKVSHTGAAVGNVVPRAFRGTLLALLLVAISFALATPAWANGTAQAVPFSQGWTDTGQISKNNNWDNVPGINGYRGGDIQFTAGGDPQGVVLDGAATGLNVIANQTNPNTNTSGGVAEFQITDPTVALQPTDTTDVPHLVMNLDTRNKKNVNVSYLLRDIDGSADNAQQQMALQYRVGATGNYTNLSAGYVQDATTGPGLANKTTQVGVTLPAAAENQALVQVRVASANAVGTDEWVGVDDVKVSSVPAVSITGPTSANEGETKTYDYTVSDTDAGDTFTVKNGFPDCGAGGTLAGTPTKTSTGGSFQCRFPDGPASPNVRVGVADSRGLDSNTASQAVTVGNVAPAVTLSGPAGANEGETKTYDFAVTDPGQDTYSARAGFPDCGTGGTFVSGSLRTGAAGGGFQCRFPDGPASPGVGMQVADEDGGNSNVATRNVTVSNVAPAIELGGPTAADEGQTKSYTYEISDPGNDPDPAVTEDCGPNGRKTDTPASGGFECRFPDGPATSAVAVSSTDKDGAGGEDSAQVDVSNVAPAAAGDPAQGAYAAEEDANLSVAAGGGLLANDSDPGEDRLTARKVSGPDHGTAQVSEDGSFVYRPNGDYNGADSFAYEACDEDGSCSPTATARVQVAAVNDAPVVDLNGGAGGTGHSATFTEGDGPVALADRAALSVTDVDDAEVRSATVTLGNRPDGDAETLAADASGTGISVDYDRPTGELRLDGPAPKAEYQKVLRTVTYENSSQDPATADRSAAFAVNDGDANSGTAASTLAVRAVNDAPEISDIPDAATDEDTPTEPVPFTVRDVDTPAGDLTLSGSSDDAQLVPEANIEFGGADEGRTVRVTPAADRFGRAGISVRINDGALDAADGFVLTVRDTTPPSAPTVDLDAAGDTGASDTDDVTRDASPPFSGAAEAGSEVVLFDGETRIATVRADGGAWRHEVPEGAALGDGEHRITATATDAAGNTSGPSGALNVVVDRRAPDTFVDSSPSNYTNKAASAFEFSSDEAGASFECFVDDVNFEACSSPKEYTGLPDGAHAFEARAVDRAGNVDPSPAMRTWTVDTRAPEATLTEPSDGALVRGEVKISAEASDDRELQKVEFLVDGEVADVDRGAGPDRREPYEFGWDTTLEEDGEHQIEARATDAAGNETSPGPRTVRVDNTAPDTSVDSSSNEPTNAARISFGFSSAEAGATFECSLDGAGFESCESPKEYTGLPDGDHLFRVRAVDGVGNRDDSPAERVVTIDTQKPEAPSVERPSEGALDNDGALAFSGAAEPGSRVRIFEVTGGGEELRATARRTGENGNWSVGFTGVTDGEHSYVAAATDAAGNESGRSGARTITVDTAPPEVTGRVPHVDQPDVPINTDVEAVFSKKMDESTLEGNFTLTRGRDGSVVPGRVTYDAATNSAVLLPEDALGYSEAYSVTVRGGENGVKDLAGNGLSADETWNFTTSEEPDTTAPGAPTIERPAEDAHDDDGAFTLSGTAEPESRLKVFDGDDRVGGALANSEGAWSLDLADVPEGRYAFAATATDASHNESERSAGRTVTVDLTNPDTLIDASPASVTNETAASFRFRSDEPGAAFECSMDGGPFERCSSPLEYGDLADGEHVFDVRAVDRAGNTDPSAAQRSFAVDTKLPEVRLTAPADGALVRDEVGLTAEASDDGGVKRVRFLIDGQVVDSDLGGPYEFGWDSTLVEDGRHSVEVKATDEAGNTATSAQAGVRVDNTAPDTSVDSSPNTPTNEATVPFRFSSGDEGATFECSLNGDPFEPCASPQEYTGLRDGDYLFAVRATDGAGNRDDTPAQRRFAVDTTGPRSRVDSGPAGLSRSRAASFALSADEPDASFECSLDGDAFASCSSPQEYAGLPDGRHAFRVRATDALGNAGPASDAFAWTVDATAPRVLRTTPAAGAKNVFVRSGVVVYLSEKVNRATVNTKTFRLQKGAKAVPARVTYDEARNRAILKPKASLAPKSVYTAVVVGKAGGIKDLAGNPLAANRTWRFTTR